MTEHGQTTNEVDIIIAGGGAAGCVVAARLAKADPSLSILIIEAGINNRDNPQIVNPAMFLSNLAPNSTTATHYKAKASKVVAGREVVVTTGGCLGGGSSINFMVYSRALETDFEDWNTKGWKREDLVPLLRKMENFHDDSAGIDKSVHGYEGEFQVSGGTLNQKRFQDDYIRTAASMGIRGVRDGQNLREGNSVGPSPMWVNAQTGARQDVPHRLVHPILDAGNTKLQVLTESKIVRVLFNEERRAVGVEYVPTKTSHVKGPVVVKARKLVVLSAGALGTPLILQRSGVGDAQKLTPLGIPIISEVNGVGTNYQDHQFISTQYFSKATPEETLDGFHSGRLTMEQALQQKNDSLSTSVLGSNGISSGGKLRPSAAEVKSMGPDFELLWNRDFKDRESRPMILTLTGSFFLGDHSAIPAGQHFLMGTYTAYPYSRGSIHITGTSIEDPPDFDAGYLSHPVDVIKQVWAYKKQRELARRLDHYAGAMEFAHPKFPEGSKAGFQIVDEADATKSVSGKPQLKDIEYSQADDEAIVQFIREHVATTWHSLGTCAMKPLEHGGTVDESLNVYGVKGLKIADMSIVPQNVGGNTYSTALLVGEKAATIIGKELGL